MRPGVVARPRLIERFRASETSPVVLVLAPPGYGKTTLLAQWGQLDVRPFVWLTLDESDNDPSTLLSYIVFAFDDVIDLRSGEFPRPPESGPGFITFALPRLTRALARRAQPFVFVLDDVHLLHDREALDLIGIVIRNLPRGSRLVLAGRVLPPLPLSRLLVDRSLLTIGSRELAMTELEATELLHVAGLPVGGSETALLVDRTEGWPAGLYLAALALRDQEHLGRALDSFAGTDGLVSEYLRNELLEGLPRDRRAFLMGTAVLDRLSGPLCDAVLDSSGSAAKLDKFERANLFLTPIDRNRVWFRRHPLFTELLVAELRRRHPEREAVQHRRAAIWFEENGDPDQALAHARAAGDFELAASIIARHVVPFISTGRASTLRSWIESLPIRAVDHLPWFGAAAALAFVSNGDAERGVYWLGVAERGSDEGAPLPDGRSSLRSAVAITRATLGVGGLGEMAENARIGYELEPKGSPWRALCASLQGAASRVRGDVQDALAKFEEAAHAAFAYPNIHAFSLAQLAGCHVEMGDWDSARDVAERAVAETEREGLDEYGPASMVYAISSLVHAHRRQVSEARRDAARATRLFTVLSSLAPWAGIPGRIDTALAYLLIGDAGEAKEIIRAARRDLARLLPDAAALRERLEAVSQMSAQRDMTGAPPLTAAEIRVVQFLPTHLSFGEIADRLHVSRNTVKTQVISAYRKFGVSTRSEAVEHARSLAIIES